MTELKLVANNQNNQNNPGEKAERFWEPRPLVDLMFLSEEETPALADISDAAFRLLVDMVVSAHVEMNGIAGIRGFHPAFEPRPFETPAAVKELVDAGLITHAGYEDDNGKWVDTGDFYVNIWEEMTNASAQ